MKSYRRILCILIAMALILSGCSNSGPGEGKGEPEKTEAASEAAKEPVTEGTTAAEAEAEESAASTEKAAFADAGIYPTEWDLTKIYKNKDEWLADYDKAMEMLPHYEDFRGTLNTAQGLYDYLQFSTLGELYRIQYRLALYLELAYNLNPADPEINELIAKYHVMDSQTLQYMAFAEPEIFALPLNERQQMLADPLLEPYAYSLRKIADPEHKVLSEEENAILAVLSPAKNQYVNLYDILTSVDVPDPVITMPDGTEEKLTNEMYNRIVYSDEYDREFKKTCNQVYLTKNVPYANTFAALLDSTIKENWAYAQINGFESSREAAMETSDVAPEIYDMVIAAARQGAKDYQRYLNAHKRALGLKEQYPFDTATPASDYAAPDIPFETAVEQVRNALGVWGDDYLAYYDELVNSGQIDVYPTETKTPLNFSMSGGGEFRSFLMFNYTGNPQNVGTIAHEMGHSIYSSYAADHQNAANREPSIFTQEVASTTNELLYNLYMKNNAADDDERLFYLENMLQMFSSYFFIQALYAEFEDSMYATVEAGGSLNAEMLSDHWAELYEFYRGDSMETFPDSRYQWTTIPHFFYNYYVYQYATSTAFSASICERIERGEENVVEDFKEFLKLGGSASPEELLATAGIAPFEEGTYQKAIDFFSGLVDEYEQLIDKKLNQ